MTDRKRIALQWWVVIGGITLILIVLNSPWVFFSLSDSGFLRRRAFSLKLEMNYAVWWSSVLYFLSAAIFYEIGSNKAKTQRRPYIGLSLLMLMFVVDEMGSIHERISGVGGWMALIPFAVVSLAILVDSLRLLLKDKDSRIETWLVLGGFLLLASVVGQEFAEHNLTSSAWTLRYGHFIEEATELAGALLILSAAVYHRLERQWKGPFAAVVPDPMRMRLLFPILLAGLLANFAAAQLVFMELPGPSRWYGNPAIVYPVFVFFLLACHAFWVPRRAPESARSALEITAPLITAPPITAPPITAPEVTGFWNLIAVFFLMCSLGFTRNFWVVLPHVIPGVKRGAFFEPITIYFILTLVVWFFALNLRRTRALHLMSLIGLLAAPAIDLYLEHPGASYKASGVFAFFCACIFLWPAESAEIPTGIKGDRVESQPV